MGFMEKFGAQFGYGLAELTVTLDEPTQAYLGGDTIKGTVTIRGGKLDQVGQLSIQLCEIWYEVYYTGKTPTNTQRNRYHNETLLAENLELKAGEDVEEFRFALTMIPDGCLTHQWSVMALFTTTSTASATASAPFEIAPPKEIAGLTELVQAIEPFELADCINHGTEYILNFLPTTPELKARFDAIRLTLHRDPYEEKLTGELLINPQEHTLAEHLQSILQLNNRTTPISLTAAEIAKGSEGEAATTLRGLLGSGG